MFLLYILAQTTTPTVDPTAPWLSLLLQGGGFGLAVVIVTVLYPRAAKDAREERDRRDAMWLGLVTGLQDKFEERNALISRSIEKQTDTLNVSYKDSAVRIEQAVVNVCRGRFSGTRAGDQKE